MIDPEDQTGFRPREGYELHRKKPKRSSMVYQVSVPVRGMSCIPSVGTQFYEYHNVSVPVRGMSCIPFSHTGTAAQFLSVSVPVRGMSCILVQVILIHWMQRNVSVPVRGMSCILGNALFPLNVLKRFRPREGYELHQQK